VHEHAHMFRSIDMSMIRAFSFILSTYSLTHTHTHTQTRTHTHTHTHTHTDIILLTVLTIQKHVKQCAFFVALKLFYQGGLQFLHLTW